MHTWKEAAARWHTLGMHRAAETIRREATLLRWLAPQLDDQDITAISRAALYAVRERTICGIRGQAGTCSRARRYRCSKRRADGAPCRW